MKAAQKKKTTQNSASARNASARRRVLLVESQPIVYEKLTELINDEPDLRVCGVTDGGENIAEIVSELKPDLVIIEVIGKHGNRISQIRQIRTKNQNLPILVFSTGPCETYALRAMHAGATGYLCKNSNLADILKIVRCTLKGEPSLCASMTSQLVRQLSSGFADSSQLPINKLSNREIEVFELLGQGLGTRQVAERLSLTIPTVETYRERLKTKLNLRGASELQCAAVRWVEHRLEARP
jgi:DNA-binding NarL/FixJ family response regulator